MTTSTDELVIAQRFMDLVPWLMQGVRAALQRGRDDDGLVTIPQLRTLAALKLRPRTLSELAASYGVSPPTMSRLISTLVERGWVRRDAHPDDRRQAILCLSPAGEAAAADLDRRSTEYLAGLLAGLAPDEQACLACALDGLDRIAHRSSGAPGGAA